MKNGTELPETGPGKLEKKVLAVTRFFGQTKKKFPLLLPLIEKARRTEVDISFSLSQSTKKLEPVTGNFLSFYLCFYGASLPIFSCVVIKQLSIIFKDRSFS